MSGTADPRGVGARRSLPEPADGARNQPGGMKKPLTNGAAPAAPVEGDPYEITALRARLQEAEELIHAITRGEVDAVVRPGESGELVVPFQAADKLYRMTVETMVEGALTVAPDGLVLYCNERIAELVQAQPSQMTGTPVQRFVASEDRPRFDTLVREARTDIARGRIDLLRADGERVPTHIAMRHLQVGEMQVIVLVVTDLSALSRAEATRDRLARIVDNSQDGIIGKDLDGVVTSWNRGAETLYGYTADEMIGRNADMLSPPEHRNEHAEFVARIRRGETVDQQETQRITKAGQRIHVALTLSPITDSDGTLTGISCIARDISERRRAEQALLESELRFRALIEGASDVVVLARLDGTMAYVSPAVREVGGYEPTELVGRNFIELVHPDEVEDSKRNFAALARKPGGLMLQDRRFRHRNGSWVDTESVARNLADTPGVAGIVVNLRDVTVRKQTEAGLRLANVLIEQSPTVLFRWDPSPGWPVVYVSQNVRQWGYEPEDLLSGKQPFAGLVHPDDLPRVAKEVAEYSASGATQFAQEYRILTKAGDVRWIDDRTTIERDAAGKPLYFQGVVMDVSERNRAEQERVATLARIRNQLDALGHVTHSEALLAGDVDALARESTELAAQVTGVERVSVWLFDERETELHCIDLYETTPARHSAGAVLRRSQYQNEFDAFRRSRYIAADDPLTDPRTAGYVESYLEPTGITSMLDAVIQLPGQNTGVLCFEHVGPAHHWEADEIAFACQLADQIGFAVATAQRQRDQSSLRRVNRALTTLSAGNTTVVHAASEDELLQRMCRVIVETGGYALAWVGIAEADAAKTVRPVAKAGKGAGYVDTAAITWADTGRGRGPAGRCIRSGKPQTVRDIAGDPLMAPWHEQAVKYGYRSCLALPLATPGGVFAVLMIYSGESDAFDADELALLTEMAGDLAYGITALRTRTAHDEGLRRLERSMEATVAALASTVEMRDPYTGGHQQRVATIATAIAGAMKLPKDRIHGLALAASIHDIGKINIPAEILAKPGRLTPVEYELVKGHAEAGYQIMKDVEFPWPVADMIHQHHERMDGSGYPQGLSGEQILPESRILAVADVVEAIASHRPYRPALGLATALEEISKGRGTRYCAEVADACLKLFQEDGFCIPDRT